MRRDFYLALVEVVLAALRWRRIDDDAAIAIAIDRLRAEDVLVLSACDLVADVQFFLGEPGRVAIERGVGEQARR